MVLPRLSRRHQAGLAVAMALLLVVPMGISQAEQTMVTGHSTFYNGATYDPCMASIAGIIRNRVMWFDDTVLVESYGGRGTFMYVTERGAPDPRSFSKLYTEGVFYDFVDPNGAHWRVEEAFYNVTISEYASVNEGPSGVPTPTALQVSGERTYVWIVELAATPIYDEFAGGDDHTIYNFLVLADTCKMRSENAQPGKTGEADPRYNVSHADSSVLDAENGHENGAAPHSHEAKMADLWVGKRPTLQPLPSADSTDGVMWESSWATSGNPQNAAESGAYRQQARANSTSGGALP